MKVNGEERSLPQEERVVGVVGELGVVGLGVGVENMGCIVPRAGLAEEKLTDADHLEVVCFVGGG